MIDLSIDLNFLQLKNPVIAASGTFGYGLEFTPFIDLNRIGGFVVKGLFASPRAGNPPPRLVETASGLINAIGLQGIGMKRFAEEIMPQLQELDTAIIINVCGENDEEYIQVVEYLNDLAGISAYELNLSCPNVEKGGQCPALSSETTYTIVKQVKKVSRLPIITKLSPNVTDISEVAVSAEEAGSDAVSLINTILAMAIDPDLKKPVLSNIMGGLSGPAIKPIALRMVFQVAGRINIPIIGIGGIMSGRDAVEFLLAGASAVEVGTANLVDPEACLRIIDELKTYCQENRLANLKSIIGALEL